MGDSAAFRELIRLGAQPTYVDRTGNNFLHLACMFNRTDLIDFLLEKGCDPMYLNPMKETPIDIAAPALQIKLKAKLGKQ